ncbi:MAG: permease [Chloroflexaceae bacterium]|nr:permease [Chloroflexaceae bacterium]
MEVPHQSSASVRDTAKRLSPWSVVRRSAMVMAWILVFLLLWLASALAVPPNLATWTGRLQGFTTVFLGIFIEALPFLLAGVLVSSILHLYISAERLQRMTPHHPLLAALSGALLGLALPVCECGAIPAARRLLQKGVALPVGIAFVLAAPVINPIVIISTAVAFGGWEMVAWRVGLTLLFAVIIGVLLGTAVNASTVLAPNVLISIDEHDHDHTCDHDHDHGHEQETDRLRQVLSHARSEFFEMGRFLVLGALLAAALQTLIPQQPLLALGNGPVISVLVLMALAVVLSVCSTVDSFIALSFVNTFTPGAVLAFLVFGPMIDIKSTLMLTTTFRRRIVVIIVLLCFQLALLAGIACNFLL